MRSASSNESWNLNSNAAPSVLEANPGEMTAAGGTSGAKATEPLTANPGWAVGRGPSLAVRSWCASINDKSFPVSPFNGASASSVGHCH